jgi:hypothetical protein
VVNLENYKKKKKVQHNMQGNNVALLNVNIPVFIEEMEISLVMCEYDFCSPCRTKVLYGRNAEVKILDPTGTRTSTLYVFALY